MNSWSPATPLKIFIAPDSYKSTASATTAAQHLNQGVQRGLEKAGITPDSVEITTQPLADGGEGSAQLFPAAARTLPTTTANGALTEATYFYDAAKKIAYIDLAAASGLPAVEPDLRPLSADTYGTGVLIAAALAEGAEEIVLGLGGSATTDGGSGILVALGALLLDTAGTQLAPGGAALQQLDHIDLSYLNPDVAGVRFRLLSDVSNPATGPEGTAYIFAPQKGANPEQCAELDAGIAQLCKITDTDPTTTGFGAAGGAAISISWLTNVLDPSGKNFSIEPGAQTILRSLGQEQALAQADLVITGEGACDQTSFSGKVVGTLVELAKDEAAIWVATGKLAEGTDLPENVHAHVLIDAPVAEQLENAGEKIIAEFLSAE